MLIRTQGATIFGEARVPIQGATIFSGIPANVVEDVAAIFTPLPDAVQLNPANFPSITLPPYDPTPTHWRVYNRWTGRYVSDVDGSEPSGFGCNEHPNCDRAFPFPSAAAAAQRAQQIATALAQPPPDDLPYCDTCYAPQARGTVNCPQCNGVLETPKGWVHVWPFNANGQIVGRATMF